MLLGFSGSESIMLLGCQERLIKSYVAVIIVQIENVFQLRSISPK